MQSSNTPIITSECTRWNRTLKYDSDQSNSIIHVEGDQLCKFMVINEHQYVTKMALSVSMGSLWGNFNTIFWIIEYLERPIYSWNKYQNALCFDMAWIFNLSPYI